MKSFLFLAVQRIKVGIRFLSKLNLLVFFIIYSGLENSLMRPVVTF